MCFRNVFKQHYDALVVGSSPFGGRRAQSLNPIPLLKRSTKVHLQGWSRLADSILARTEFTRSRKQKKYHTTYYDYDVPNFSSEPRWAHRILLQESNIGMLPYVHVWIPENTVRRKTLLSPRPQRVPCKKPTGHKSQQRTMFSPRRTNYSDPQSGIRVMDVAKTFERPNRREPEMTCRNWYVEKLPCSNRGELCKGLAEMWKEK